jgi:opacity protein-like surface antigen
VGGFDANSGSAFEVVRTASGLARVSTSSSDWSYQVQGGVEVQLARHVWTQIGWRYLKYDYKIEGFVNQTHLNGPFIQAGVNF